MYLGFEVLFNLIVDIPIKRFLVAIAFMMSLTLRAADQKKILIVLSSYGKDGGKTGPGYEFD